MEFNQPDLASELEDAHADDLNRAPFGVVEFDTQGTILFYNQYEAELAGISSEHALGKNFFTEIAPCINNFMVATRYESAAAANQNLDETIDYVFTYKLKPTKVTLRMLRQNRQQWLCVEKQ